MAAFPLLLTVGKWEVVFWLLAQPSDSTFWIYFVDKVISEEWGGKGIGFLQ